MALSNYTDLLAAINGAAAWLHRTDLGTIAPDWVTLCEATINYGGRIGGQRIKGLRTKDQETVTTLSTVGGTQTVALPSGFLQARRLYYTLGGVRVEIPIRPAQPLSTYESSNAQGPISTAFVQGTNLYLIPIPDTVYTLTLDYYAKVGPLATSSTNWLMTASPMVYLHGSIAHGALWMGAKFAKENGGVWLDGFISALEGIRQSDNDYRFRNTTMRSEAAQFQNRPFNIVTGDFV